MHILDISDIIIITVAPWIS